MGNGIRGRGEANIAEIIDGNLSSASTSLPPRPLPRLPRVLHNFMKRLRAASPDPSAELGI